MAQYDIGSFTKNFGWRTEPPGFRKLHRIIRAGFREDFQTIDRDEFRRASGLTKGLQLIPVNFFLHNTIRAGQNYVSLDELVRHSLGGPHSKRFDQLALFSLHLARTGPRRGIAGTEHGAGYTNHYVRTRLWESGAWRRSHLRDEIVEASFEETIQAQGSAHKCATNYLFLLEIAGHRQGPTEEINTRPDEWVGPALFLAFDRYWLDEFPTGNFERHIR